MKFDIVFVTYNSEKWLEGCIKSILNSDYDLKNIFLICNGLLTEYKEIQNKIIKEKDYLAEIRNQKRN